MIKGVVFHLQNDQPVVADLYDLPQPGDTGVRCTNLRGMDGRKPIYIDDQAALFWFPLHVIRFLEVPASQLDGLVGRRMKAIAPPRQAGSPSPAAAAEEPVIALGAPSLEAAAAAEAATAHAADADAEALEEDILERIRQL